MDERDSVLSFRGPADRARACHVRRFAVGVDVDFAAAVLDEGGLLGVRRRVGARDSLGGYFGLGRAGGGVRQAGARMQRGGDQGRGLDAVEAAPER